MEIKCDREAGTVSLANPRHAIDLLKEYRMETSNPARTPTARGEVLGDGDTLPEGNRYAELFGSLLYARNPTRPDTAYAVGRLARRMSNPTEGDWKASKTVVRYLRRTQTMGLVYGSAQALAGWVDSDVAGEKDSRKSTTGFVFTLHGGAVSWRSRLQRLVTTSTATAEYVAAAEAVKESLGLLHVAGSVGEDSGPVTLREDNQACISMASQTASTPQTKHVDVSYHFLRDCVARKQTILEYVSTDDELADGFTKALSADQFSSSRKGLGVGDVEH